MTKVRQEVVVKEIEVARRPEFVPVFVGFLEVSSAVDGYGDRGVDQVVEEKLELLPRRRLLMHMQASLCLWQPSRCLCPAWIL